MECTNHPGAAASGTCQICGRALCGDCLNRFSPPACEPCLHEHNSGVARRLLVDIGITTVIFFGVMIAMAARSGDLKSGFLLGLIISCAYWGWQFIGRFPVPIVFTTGAGLATYLFIKILLAMCFGFLVAPWQIFKRVKELVSINTLKKQIAEGKV